MSTLAVLTTDGREQLVAAIAREVVLRLRSPGAPAREPLAAAARPAALGRGVFGTVDAAVEAAARAQRRVQAMSLEEGGRAIAIIRRLCDEQAPELARRELDETGIGRLDHKIEKLQAVKRVLGVEALRIGCQFGKHSAQQVVQPVHYPGRLFYLELEPAGDFPQRQHLWTNRRGRGRLLDDGEAGAGVALRGVGFAFGEMNFPIPVVLPGLADRNRLRPRQPLQEGQQVQGVLTGRIHSDVKVNLTVPLQQLAQAFFEL